MNGVELRVESRAMENASAVWVGGFEEYFCRRTISFTLSHLPALAVPARRCFGCGRGDSHGPAQEIAHVAAELEQSLVGGVFGALHVLEPLGGLGAEAGHERAGFFDDVGGERVWAFGGW